MAYHWATIVKIIVLFLSAYFIYAKKIHKTNTLQHAFHPQRLHFLLSDVEHTKTIKHDQKHGANREQRNIPRNNI